MIKRGEEVISDMGSLTKALLGVNKQLNILNAYLLAKYTYANE
jgi:hypothetical protein